MAAWGSKHGFSLSWREAGEASRIQNLTAHRTHSHTGNRCSFAPREQEAKGLGFSFMLELLASLVSGRAEAQNMNDARRH